MKNFNQLFNLFQQYLEQNRFLSTPDELYQPVNYILDIGGKRIRPILLLMGYNLFKEDVEQALPAAFSIELFHNFSLMHDDIMDQAPLRRGQPSVHIKYGIETGILSGDLTLIQAYQFLLQYADLQYFGKIVSLFNELAVKVCGALQIGAVLAEASTADQEAIGEFGRNIGIAFQLQDDILDSFGDPKKFGKKVGGDIAQNKKTYLLLKALEVADPQSVKSIQQWLQTPTSAASKEENAKIEAIKALYVQLGVLEDAKILKQKYQQAAFDALAQISVGEGEKAIIANLAEDLLSREA